MREHERSVQQPWGTLEELLLAAAVNRHGTASWDAVYGELKTRISVSGDHSPENCRRRFDHLRRRFSLLTDGESTAALIDRLTKIRVDELRRDLRRRDSFIASLELKVHSLEEEREKSLKPEKNDDGDGSEKKNPAKKGGERATEFVNRRGSKSDGSNRSFDESNSTTQRRDFSDSDSKRKRNFAAVKLERDESDRGREEEENNNSAKQSSEVQSSSKRRRRAGEEAEEVSPATAITKRAPPIKSEPLIAKLLGMVRSHRLGSVFQRRLRSQESQRYKSMVKQHLDLQTIEARAEKGVYSESINKFYRDLLVLFTNGVVFFRRGTQENVASKELRSMVLKEMKTDHKRVGKTKTLTVITKPSQPKREKLDGPTPNVDAVVLPKSKNKSPIIVTCGRRNTASNAAPKPTSDKKASGDNHKKGRAVLGEEVKVVKPAKKANGSAFGEEHDDKGVWKNKKKSQESVVGLGRKGSKNHANNSSDSNSNSNANNNNNNNIKDKGNVKSSRSTSTANSEEEEEDEEEKELNEREFGGNELSSHDTTAVKSKKKETVTTTTTAKKKQGVASFLKRMKQNSPKKDEENSASSDREEEEEISDNEDGEEEEEEEKEKEDHEDRRKVEKEDEDEKTKKNKGKGKKAMMSNSSKESPSKDQRVTRNSTKSSRAAKEETDRKLRRGVGRPPKKPEKAGPGRRESNGDHHQPRKRARR